MKFYGWRFPVYFTEHLQATKYDPSLHRKKSFSIKDFFSKMENFLFWEVHVTHVYRVILLEIFKNIFQRMQLFFEIIYTLFL